MYQPHAIKTIIINFLSQKRLAYITFTEKSYSYDYRIN